MQAATKTVTAVCYPVLAASTAVDLEKKLTESRRPLALPKRAS